MFVDEVSHLATMWQMLIGALAVSSAIEVDFVRIVVATGRQTSARPIEEISAGDIGVNVPFMVKGVVFGAVRVDQRFDEDLRVFVGVVFRLPEQDPTGYWVGENGLRRPQRSSLQSKIGASPTGRLRIVVDDH